MPTRTYVRTEKDLPVEGVISVVEVITTGQDINTMYHPDFVAMMLGVGDTEPIPDQWWTYDGETFHPPQT
ncbi:hypothetical protein K6V92_02030 [Cupriavidus respiraculi]|uniref:hypothetical protein n=1 Tax=Cupriavidus respiraculi TaxID=195930 RepID=UPI001C982539|nr:hypothetical protein [Cupriavidus respiraculi]MBY4945402.1 hypothetical protein [Cupriavidus respiraculi]